MENELEKRIILDQKQREYEQMKEKFKEARKIFIIQRNRWKKPKEKI